MQTISNETLAVVFPNVVQKKNHHQSFFHRVFGIVMFWKVALTIVVCLCGSPSDERHSVQPSDQVHRSLRRPAQHLHRHRILPPRQPAGNVTFHLVHRDQRMFLSCGEKTLNPNLFSYILSNASSTPGSEKFLT